MGFTVIKYKYARLVTTLCDMQQGSLNKLMTKRPPPPGISGGRPLTFSPNPLCVAEFRERVHPKSSLGLLPGIRRAADKRRQSRAKSAIGDK